MLSDHLKRAKGEICLIENRYQESEKENKKISNKLSQANEKLRRSTPNN